MDDQRKRRFYLERLFDNSGVDIKKCWEWKKSCTNAGYSKTTIDGKTVSGHRAMYEMMWGKIKEKGVIMHTCDNKKCINPFHLFDGSTTENMFDMASKKRHR